MILQSNYLVIIFYIQVRKNHQGGGISTFLYESLSFKRQQDLGINSEAVESLSAEILNKKCKNIILNTICRPPNKDIETCENYFKIKYIVLAGDFNLNVLDLKNNKKVQNFINLMFRYGMIPTINKPTRVTANTTTAMDHIITNVIIDTDLRLES